MYSIDVQCVSNLGVQIRTICSIGNYRIYWPYNYFSIILSIVICIQFITHQQHNSIAAILLLLLLMLLLLLLLFCYSLGQKNEQLHATMHIAKYILM